MYSIVLCSVTLTCPRVYYREDDRNLSIFACTSERYPTLLELKPGVVCKIPHTECIAISGMQSGDDATNAALAYFGRSAFHTRLTVSGDGGSRTFALVEPYLVAYEGNAINDGSIREMQSLKGSWDNLKYCLNANIIYRDGQWRATPHRGDMVTYNGMQYRYKDGVWTSEEGTELPSELTGYINCDLNKMMWYISEARIPVQEQSPAEFCENLEIPF